jgi:hydrogenase large subunit
VARIVIDPVTRVGGHLRVELDVASGAVTDAWSSGTMFRGIELNLRGRDPRDAWMLAERICGTCTGVHALASVRAVENALGITIPVNARVVRNLLAGTQLVRDHVVGFYQAQLPDWVDAKSAITADPSATARLAATQAQRANATAADFQAVRDRLEAVVASRQAGVLGTGWWGHPAYRLSPEQNLLLLAHFLEALDWQRDFMRIHALLGGKDPHPQTYLVGGMAVAPPWGGPTGAVGRDHPTVPDRNAPMPLSADGLTLIDSLLVGARDFVDQVFVPDVRLLLGAYPEWAKLGAGPGSYLSAGDLPDSSAKDPQFLFPTGRLATGNLAASLPVEQDTIAESVAAAWYTYASAADGLVAAVTGETTPAWPGLALPLKTLEGARKYSWIKAARYEGIPMEVGPLARLLVAVANGRAELGSALAEQMGPVGLTLDTLPGVAGRILARTVEAAVVIRQAATWLADLRTNLGTGDVAVADITYWDPASWPKETHGFSLGEGPRGMVGHWVTIRDRVVADYQVVDASTWNASPRDSVNGHGPIEAALAGVPIADPARPLEALRVVHSFSPCGACATHVFGPRATPREGTR